MENQLNVLLTFNIDPDLVEKLQAISPRLNLIMHPANAVTDIPPDVWSEVEVLFTAGVLPDKDMAPKLRWVQATSAGIDSMLDNPLFEGHDVLLTTASGIHAVTMAEYALGMMLAFAHRIPTMIARRADHDWPKDRFQLYAPQMLRGATVGIVGYGKIGREVARLARAFGMEVLATKRDAMQPADRDGFEVSGIGDPDGALVHRLYPPEALKSMLKECDYTVLLVPLTPETEHMFDADAVAAIKPGGVLINLARGGIVDEKALHKALKSGALAGAAFDVFEMEPLPEDSPLWESPNLIISPHIAGNMDDYLERALDVLAENLERYLARRDLVNVVDWERGY